MRFVVATLSVLLGLFAVGSSVPTGSQSSAQLALNKETSFFVHNTYSVGDELKVVGDEDSKQPTVKFTFATSDPHWRDQAAEDPEAAAYARSNAFLLIQLSEKYLGLKRPYIVRFPKMSPASSLFAKTNGFDFKFSAPNGPDQYVLHYTGHVDACKGDCKDPHFSIRQAGFNILISEGSVLQKPTQKNQKDVMGQCVEYLNTAF
ncbi:hypothetical protein F5890DRAFT_1561590 [Lentinula detonsa]|uniref:Uncharacterized protein n=1 Tax=Lentinula detonsa TaxID=2804962 RepID=A0AA38UWW7_9AGAR|nr:hypothetical protein F5890DRAFT_1561590 [Lentinula detonsa]